MRLSKNQYDYLQDRFTRKLNQNCQLTKREDGYNDGILACKSILKEVYRYPEEATTKDIILELQKEIKSLETKLYEAKLEMTHLRRKG